MTTLQFDHQPSEAVLAEGERNLRAFNRQFLPAESNAFGIAARTEAGVLAAVAAGASYWGRLYLDRLWVSSELRGQGIGRQILAAVELLARDRGCRGVDLWTMTFQAPGFYEKAGYRQVGEIAGYDGGFAKRFYSKELA